MTADIWWGEPAATVVAALAGRTATGAKSVGVGGVAPAVWDRITH